MLLGLALCKRQNASTILARKCLDSCSSKSDILAGTGSLGDVSPVGVSPASMSGISAAGRKQVTGISHTSK